MWVRAVAAALAVWCVSDAAMAAAYTEVWNPPEASRHVAKPAKKKPGAAKVKAGGGLKAGSKVPSKAGSKHMASARHAAPRVMSTAGAGAGRGNRLAAHGSVKKVAANGTTKSGVRAAAVGQLKAKAVVTAQARKPHAQFAQSKPGQGKVMRADLVQSRAARPRAIKVAAKTSVAKPAVSHMNAPAPSANVGAGPVDAATNPATASSSSLPPIIH